MKLLITNIQNFCLHDGPGIRTTVFMKGCNLHCPWCCNPENIAGMPQYYYAEDKCISDGKNCIFGKCIFEDRKVSIGKLEKITEDTLEMCSCQAISQYGKYYEVDDLYVELIKEKPFWGKEGGITFSGGEPLLHIDKLIPLLERLKYMGINLCVETALFVNTQNVALALKYFDYFIVDMKILKADECRNIIGGDINVYLTNLEFLYNEKVDMEIHIPMIKNYVNNPDNMKMIYDLLSKYRTKYVVVPEHYLGEKKRKSLCM